MYSYLRRSFIFLGMVSVLCCSSGISYSQVRVVYTYPSRNATQVSAKTTIGIRYAEAISKSLLSSSSFTVTGTLSGIHSGKVKLAGHMRTIIFTPDNFFSGGEKVEVSVSPLQCKSGKMTDMYNFTFHISKSKILPSSLSMMDDHESHTMPFLSNSAPSDSLPADFPPLEITKNTNPSPGHFYLTNFTYVQSPFGPYLMILDNSGNVLFQRSTYPLGAEDFRLQPNGLFTYFDQQAKKFYGMDSNFIVRDTFAAANGYETDYRELCFLPIGGYALLAKYSEKVDLRKIAGDSDASVIYYVLQEFDQDKNLIFEWRTADSGHFAITDAKHEDLSLHSIDYVHCNSIEFDVRDSTLLLSSRNVDEVTKINSEDGSILWRLGGEHNQFTFKNDTLPFSHQHDVRRLPNGNITLFDNGNFRNPPPTRYSCGVEYSLDENAKTITKVWEYRHDPDIYADAMGSVQRLGNGNTVIGWGLSDSVGVALTEVESDGTTVWEMRLPIGEYNYRMYKMINDGLKSVVVSRTATPTISLEQNYPNPFVTSSIIHFTANGRTPVTLIVYDALGREVRTLFNGSVDEGKYSANFEARNLPDGMYICKLTTPSESLSRTLIVAK